MSEPHEESVSTETATRLHFHIRNKLPMWIIYRPTTKDFPGRWVGRLHITLPRTYPTNVAVFGDTLDEVRNKLPKGLRMLSRSSEDFPVIEEVWL
jgi:hypothetical protein